jgi:hypothetical protein
LSGVNFSNIVPLLAVALLVRLYLLESEALRR